MIRHADLLVGQFGDPYGINLFRRHATWYLKGFPVGPMLRDALARVESVDQLGDLVGRLDAAVPFPDAAHRMVRGHSHGPRPVRLPHGFLATRKGDRLGRDADQVVSGG
jgi:hypothetical protein